MGRLSERRCHRHPDQTFPSANLLLRKVARRGDGRAILPDSLRGGARDIVLTALL